MYKAYSEVVDFGSEKRRVAVINVSPSQSLLDRFEAPKLHHIHVLDKSGSMYQDIDTLIDNVQKTLETIHADDLVSIIWFSSPGSYHTLVRGAQKSPELISLLDTLRSAGGTTCFSDPIKEVTSIVDELYPLCPNICVTFFTDGQTVTPWSEDEERSKIFQALSRLSPKLLAFNTIGYGQQYNQKLLKDMSATTTFGEMVHSSKIDEYLSIFSRHFDVLSDSIFETVTIAASDKTKILYLSRNFLTESETLGQFSLQRLNKEKNQFVLISDSEDHFSFKIDSAVIKTHDLPEISKSETITNILYARAYLDYYADSRYSSLQVLAKLGDKNLIDSGMTAFTYNETSVHLDKLRKAVFSTKHRLLSGRCGSEYIPAEDAFCVLDVLSILSSSDSKYVPFGKNIDKYRRTTREKVDLYNQFIFPNDEITAPFSDFVSNQEFLNLSIRFAINGSVALNPASAKRVQLPEVVPATIFRNHSIINDGMLNLTRVEVLLDPEATSKLSEKGLFTTGSSQTLGTVEIDSKIYTRAVLDLTGLPLLNRKCLVASKTPAELLVEVDRIVTLEARAKVLNHFISQVYALNPVAAKTQEFKSLTVDQIEVLKEAGLDEKLWYSPVASTCKAVADSDSYEARSIAFQLKGVSSLPSISEVISRLDKSGPESLTISQRYIYSALLAISAVIQTTDSAAFASISTLSKAPNVLRDTLEKLLKDTKYELNFRRTELVATKMAVVLSGDWFRGFTKDPKKPDSETFSVDEKTLVLKKGRVRRYY